MWDPKEELIEGRLCEKGLLKERYDNESDELVRNLTEEGKKVCIDMLKQREWQIECIKIMKEKGYPLEEILRFIKTYFGK